MKKILSLIVMCVLLTTAKAQLSTTITSAKNYIDSAIVANGNRQIGGTAMNAALNKIITALKYIDTAARFINEDVTLLTPIHRIDSSNGKPYMGLRNTDSIREGATNLFFTTARVRAALSSVYPLSFSAGAYSLDTTKWHSELYFNTKYQAIGGGTTYSGVFPIVITGTNVSADTGRAVTQLVTGGSMAKRVDSTASTITFQKTATNGSAFTSNVNLNSGTGSGSKTFTISTSTSTVSQSIVANSTPGNQGTQLISSGPNGIGNVQTTELQANLNVSNSVFTKRSQAYADTNSIVSRAYWNTNANYNRLFVYSHPDSGAFQVITDIGNYKFPRTYPTIGQILKADGSHNLYWANDSTGAGSSGLTDTLSTTALTAGVKDVYVPKNLIALGNVGIGTATPTEKLEVNGNVLIDTTGGTNNLYANNLIKIGANGASGVYVNGTDGFEKVSLYAADAPILEVTPSGISVTGTINRVKKYVALLSQSGTSAPTATVLENSLGGTVVWSYNGNGDYTATLTGAFPSGKVALNSGVLSSDPYYFRMSRIDDDSISVITQDSGGSGVDDAFANTTITITVYP